MLAATYQSEVVTLNNVVPFPLGGRDSVSLTIQPPNRAPTITMTLKLDADGSFSTAFAQTTAPGRYAVTAVAAPEWLCLVRRAGREIAGADHAAIGPHVGEDGRGDVA